MACVALGCFAPAASAETDWTALRTLNIAHQGGENEVPSNTMYSYVRALRLGYDMLEVDIHTTADGKVVVMHDGTVDRTTNGSGSVYDMTLAEIQALDAAYDFVPGLGIRSGRPAEDYRFRGIRTGERKPPLGFKPHDFRIPTLQQVMRTFPDVPINIEIKGRADTDLASFNRNAEHLAALLNSLGRTEGIIVASFNDAALQTFHQLAPEVKLAPGIAGVAAFKFGNVPPPEGTVAFQVPIEFEGIPVTDADFVQRAHAGGYAVHVWTINDEPTMLDLFDLNVDGAMSAEPARLERVLCEQEVARPPRPAGIPGKHCNHRHASIACDVFAQGPVRLLPDRLRLEVAREDDFPGRCAGRVELLPPGFHASAGFDFGERPPGEGGPESLRVAIPLSAGDREKLGDRPRVAVGATPYDAFSRRTVLGL
jgi:glycerophosphoryl diester phosphodiesterase